MKQFSQIRKIRAYKVKGMTLIELLLVLALVGILLSMAVPKLMPLIGRTKSLEAQMQLKHVLNLEKNYFYINSKYSNSLEDLGFEQSKLITEDGKANYKIEIVEANNKSFTAKAISVTDFDQDGQLNVWQINQDEEIKEVIKD
ncbi:prepilin-type N-terminal cleavage/methylation domain-containing protein [Aurantibacillus circumpalustris]|uniref:prepilin-type N-terminal cleavage/methylation domain-containing protein n=1 Tax=Aurantibacillus circumpalustris TaxID=3036359 RepID=UPI00295ADD7B|nr:prepilin-type N-terminal cleavage/methylation domain-containing protein [Aurantibacillus circumpalustris]